MTYTPEHGKEVLHYSLLTDLYQLTMAQGYWASGKLDEQASFFMFFRDNPFGGGYAIAAGMAQLAQIVDGFSFTDEDIAYLASLDAPGGGKLFDQKFLEYLHNMELSVEIDAVVEGTVVFPMEPLVRVNGPIMQCQLLETALLNCINFQTLVATKAARVCEAAQSPVAEFGLRRAQGAGGSLWASRASIVGGCASTSNVLAGKMFDLPVSGTHAHSWVMSFEEEIEAFREYARIFPKNCVLLVDTYDIKQGIKNAITVGLEMRERKERLVGIRIDSGDLAWAAKYAREQLDAAGLDDCGIVLSNDLDEYSITAIRAQGAQVASWGVGTKLATAYDQPSLGGVYKLAATKEAGSNTWIDRLKVSESVAKLTIPGVLDVRRYSTPEGMLVGDMVVDIHAEINPDEVIVDPADSLRTKKLGGLSYESLLKPLARNGKSVLTPEQKSARSAQARVRAGLAQLDETRKRLYRPHTYPVGLEQNLWNRRAALVKSLRKTHK
ncbi:MAG: nicotinate phosphoribosyltransferase [Eggerthellaceae bacterium]|nr:nicotinate phosphoribosyltransferase [Eggerthellaceae bacterium]